jgi:hypothetical protein
LGVLEKIERPTRGLGEPGVHARARNELRIWIARG